MKIEEFHKILGPFKYFLPTYFYGVLLGCFREFKNKIFWKETITNIKNNTDFFEKNNMNVSDDMTEFYFAVNMQPENKSLPKRDRDDLESRILVSSINKIENGLANFGLYDLIRFNYEHVDSYDDEAYGWVVACTFNNVSLTSRNIRYCYIYIASILVVFALILLIFIFAI